MLTHFDISFGLMTVSMWHFSFFLPSVTEFLWILGEIAENGSDDEFIDDMSLDNQTTNLQNDE